MNYFDYHNPPPSRLTQENIDRIPDHFARLAEPHERALKRATPGPWHLTVGASGVEGVRVSFRIDANPQISIASGQSQEHLGEDCGSRILEAECIANARLIAAAPDMLAALRRAVLALAFAAETSPAMRDDYEAVSAAIAKATGSGSAP
jgi:hypothetical protein